MIYEIRTYQLKTGLLSEYWKRFGEKLPGRSELSSLGGHWYTDVGRLDQMVAIWPYESIEQRADVRRRAEAAPNPVWPPDTSTLIVDMKSEIYRPAPFMTPLGERKIGPVYEMRMYTYPAEAMPNVLEVWADCIAEREELSPMAGCWYSELGGLNNFVHLWAYGSMEEREQVRKQAGTRESWPPRTAVPPVTMENKILLPAPFSPMQ